MSVQGIPGYAATTPKTKYELVLMNEQYRIMKNGITDKLISRIYDETEGQYKERAIYIFDDYIKQIAFNKEKYKKIVIKSVYIN